MLLLIFKLSKEKELFDVQEISSTVLMDSSLATVTQIEDGNTRKQKRDLSQKIDYQAEQTFSTPSNNLFKKVIEILRRRDRAVEETFLTLIYYGDLINYLLFCFFFNFRSIVYAKRKFHFS